MKFPNPVKLLSTVLVALYARWCGYETLAAPYTRRYRFRKCRRCSYNPDGYQCSACSCLIEAKISLNTEKCPKGRWNRVWLKKTRKS